MTMRHGLVVLFAFLLLPGSGVDAAAPFIRSEPLKGVIVRDRVLTFLSEAAPKRKRPRGLFAWLAPKERWEPDRAVAWSALLSGETVPTRVVCPASEQGAPRWHIGYGGVWLGCRYDPGSIPPRTHDKLYRYELSDFLRGQRRVAPGVKWDGMGIGLFAPDMGSNPLIDYHGEAVWGRMRSNLVAMIEYDYLSVAKDKALLFVLSNAKRRVSPKWSFTVYSCRAHWRKEFESWADQEWAEEEKIAVSFRESFQVLGKGEDYYFVTSSGELYVGKKSAKGKQRALVKVWSDPARPIEALITDADANRTFLFVGPAKKGGKPAFFELSDRPHLETYDPASVKPAKQGPERLRRVLHYARILVAHKKVKGAK